MYEVHDGREGLRDTLCLAHGPADDDAEDTPTETHERCAHTFTFI